MKRETVSSEHDQDKWIGRLLRRPAAGSSPSVGPGDCLDAEALAAWVDGALGAKELAAAEIHVSGCPRCTALLSAVERTASAAPHMGSRGVLFRWLVPLAAAATAVAIWVAIPEQQVPPVSRDIALPSAPEPPTVPALPAEKPQLEASPKQKPEVGRQTDALEDRRRDEVPEARKEVWREADVAPAPSAMPAAPAAAGVANEATSGAAQRLALNKMTVVESTAADPLNRWRVLSGTDIERSADGGKSWTRTTSPAGTLVAIRAVDALSATVTTSEGRILSTADGGATWTPVQETPAAPF